MSLIVQKFGGSSVADAHHLFNVAKKITDLYSKGNDIIVVVSAQGDTTDNLLELANSINTNPSKREMDAFISSGEQMSSSLLAMAIQKMGFPAISLTGWQAGFKTNSSYGNAEIIDIVTDRVKLEISKKNIVIIAGFQGVDEYGNITTLGRGGSDTSAVAIAGVMNADICKIYTDVDGIYTADPRIVSAAKKLQSISYDEMFQLSYFGAQVLNDRSISTAKKYGVEIEVLSSMLNNSTGTFVKDNSSPMNNVISGISVLNDMVKITVTEIEDKAIFYDVIIPRLKDKDIHIDTLLSSVGQKLENSITFIVPKNKLNETIKIIKESTEVDDKSQLFYEKNKSQISVINVSNNMNINIASLLFETLSESKINIEMVACNDKRVSIIIDSTSTHVALNSIHTKLFEEDNIM